MNALYEVSSLIALVMNKPNIFSQVIGILSKGTTIDVISISGGYAYFKYNNTDAYIRKNNLKIINDQPIEIKGSIIIKYLDINTQNEVYASETINNLTLGTYKYDAKSIYGYKIESSSSQSVTLTESNPNQTITFYYSKILGTVTINYIDENTNASIYQSTVIENLTLGTYTYGSISISGYNLNDSATKSVTLTEASPNTTINFKYSEILGSVVIKYINNSSSSNLLPQETFTNLKLGTYTYNSKNISGYSLVSISTQTVTLTDTTPNAEVIFKYNELLGSVTIKYIDSSSSKELESSTVISNLPLGTYSYTAKSFEGYNLNDESTKSVTLSDTNLNAVITFSYSKILGSVTIKYIDKSSLVELSPSKVIDKLELGSYSYNSISIDGYNVSGDTTKTVTLTSTNPNQVINFSYSKILGEVTIRYVEEGTDIDISEKTIYENLELGTYKYSAKSIDGYNADMLEQSVTLTDTTPKATIVFSYSEILGNITIKYLASSSLAEIAPSTTISNIVLGDYTYDAISIDGYEIIGDSSISITLTSAEPNRTISFKYNKIEVEIFDPSNAYKVPYISTYYFKTKPTIYEDILIPFYATDYDQSEYLYDKEVKLDIFYQIDEKPEKVITVSAGDNTVNLGKLSKGEHYFSLQALDNSTGLKSHRLYNEVLVIDDSYIITKEQTYTVTDDDLSKYSITKVDTSDETKMTNNRLGLTKLFSDLQSQGYKKCILPNKGYFRTKKAEGNDLVVRTGAIQIPSNFTVDMNESTFKLNTNTADIGNNTSVCDLLVRMTNCYDSHLINGILEGDRAERKALGLETGYKGEAISTFQFLGGKYSSIENLKIKQTTGHTVMSAGGISGGGTLIPNTSFEKILIYEGKIINNTLWLTSQFIDLNKFNMNYITVGRYLGYRGVRGSSLIVYYNFYDENYNFIKMIVGYQYRKTRIPTTAKYIRVSFYGDLSTDTNVSIFYFELGTNLEIRNINFEDTRTCAIATTSSSGLLIDNVSFTRCGYSITPAPVDFEDGWQDCQDVYFMNSKRIGDRVGTADIIDNAGYNHVYENNNNLGYTIRYSVVGLVIRNNTNMLTSSWQRGYETGSKFGRVENNIINGVFNSSTDDNDTREIVTSLIKSSTINCNGLLGASTKTFSYKNCVIYKFNGSRIKAINSSIHPSPYLGYDFIFENCNFYNFDNINSSIKFSFNALNVTRKFINCTFNSPSELASHNNFNSGIFTNCIFEKSLSITPNQANTLGDLQFNNCTFKDNIVIKITNSNCYIQFTNCIFEGNKTFSNYGESNSIFK